MNDSSSSVAQSTKHREVVNHRMQSKQTWDSFLNNKESLEILKNTWKVKNPQKVYEKKIRKLSRSLSKKKHK